jgi:hypothetical protein
LRVFPANGQKKTRKRENVEDAELQALSLPRVVARTVPVEDGLAPAVVVVDRGD